MSEGEFVTSRPHRPEKRAPADVDESTDTWDTIEWLLKNVPDHNGRVGICGISYPGFYTAAGMIDAHPALKAVSPQAPVADWFIGDDWHHDGRVLPRPRLQLLRGFRPQPARRRPPKVGSRSTTARPTAMSSSCGWDRSPSSTAGTSRRQMPFWKEIIEHATYDEFWKARAIWPHLKNISPR